MGVAALVLGIVSVIIGFIPFCGAIAFIPAAIGLILGIVDIVQKGKKGESKGVSIAGTVLSAIAIIVITFWLYVFGAAVKNTDVNELTNALDAFSKELNSISYDYDF